MVDVHFFAAARDAAGCTHTSLVDAEVPATLGDLLQFLSTTFTGTTGAGTSMAEVLERCSFLLDGKTSTAETPLSGVSRVDVLPPFAGG
ncbi:MoaD/ThiS family protein [Corynebacterium sp. J010B-136]|uniref:MoaD/ThiS family protein n=1 Tax=Corynebacterium sp. J010B-136 TaxID=2099401 RepID=UPI000CFA348B|nr:MoaD/ThiS family protein [Corynebacterium sp. J010B-136]PQM74146.1 molybdopterin synthase sulfur carrier subunit [Corynebacterium sp. J010B-136]